MQEGRVGRWELVTAGLFGIAALQQIWNLLHYQILMGFDAQGNWQYIASLIADWHLPAPGDGWSTAHPPFFYAVGAAVGRSLGLVDMEPVSRAVIALCGAIGLAAVASVVAYVRRIAPGDGPRLALAAFLLLFLPVRMYTSAMLGEEILAAALVTFSMIGLAQELGRPTGERSDLLRPALLGIVAGLGLLTKLSAAMPIAAGVLVLVAEGPRRGWKRSLGSALAFGGAAALAGGWFYLHNIVVFGYLYPHALPVHELMFGMPPGERALLDYVRVPLEAFGAAQASHPALLHSVWGSLWTTVWFDSHRAFVPLHPTRGLHAAATLLLVFGLVPAAAFVSGFFAGARRAVRDGSGPDRLLVAMTILLMAGFVTFTWRNPWFASIKGGYLLGLSAPYAIYASETLSTWTCSRRRRAWALAAIFGAIGIVSTVTFSYNSLFIKQEYPGTEWKSGSR